MIYILLSESALGGRDAGGSNYWGASHPQNGGFSGKNFRGASGAAKNYPFYPIFRRYWGGAKPDFAPWIWHWGAFAQGRTLGVARYGGRHTNFP